MTFIGYTSGMARENSRLRKRRDRRLKALLKTSKTFGVILNHVRNGGSLIGLCETWQIRYSDMLAWIRADKTREADYAKALEDRSEWTDEMVLAEIRATSQIDIRQLYYPKGHAEAGKLIPIHLLDTETAKMVCGYDQHGQPRTYDKLKALELTAKSRRLLTDKTELEVGDKLEDILAKSYEEPAPDKPSSEAAAA